MARHSSGLRSGGNRLGFKHARTFRLDSCPKRVEVDSFCEKRSLADKYRVQEWKDRRFNSPLGLRFLTRMIRFLSHFSPVPPSIHREHCAKTYQLCQFRANNGERCESSGRSPSEQQTHDDTARTAHRGDGLGVAGVAWTEYDAWHSATNETCFGHER